MFTVERFRALTSEQLLKMLEDLTAHSGKDKSDIFL